MKTTKTTDAKVAKVAKGTAVAKAAIAAIAELAHEAMGPTAPEAFVGPVAPVTPDAPATGTVATSVTLYRMGPAASTVRKGNTLQGAHLKAGKAWRQAGYTAPSVRNAALQALADLGDTFTKDQALAALQKLADAGQLGCSTPATRLSKFLRSGHLAVVA